MKQLFSLFTVLFTVILLSGYSFAQDAAKVDSTHYEVEFENDQVRVLRITYAPGEKGIMHSHPESMVIGLSDAEIKFTLPDGKTVEANLKDGSIHWIDASTHQPENIGDEPLELIQIEMKDQ